MNKKHHYITPSQVLAIHDQVIERFGGSTGLRDLSLLISSVLRPQASFDGNDLYPTLFEKAAALLQSLLKNHPFVDGNKRTSLTSTGIFLQLNGWEIENSHGEEVDFAIRVDNENLTLEQICLWLKQHSKEQN